MHSRTACTALVLVLAATIFLAGCTGTTPGPGTTPTPGATIPQTTQPPRTTATTAPSGDCIVPQPTVTVDPRYVVDVQVTRDPVSLNKKITVSFRGGKGQFLTQRVDAKITREDCTTETKSITRPESGSIIAGSSVSFNGSDRDRVEVTVTINGVPYKIIDQVYQFQARA